MGGGINFDPSLSLSGVILAIMLLVIVWQLLGHGARFFSFIYRKFVGKEETMTVSDLPDDEDIGLNIWQGGVALLFYFGLTAIYLIFIFRIVNYDYLKLSRKVSSFDKYQTNILDISTPQLLVVSTACLLWCFASKSIRRFLILPGLLIVFMDVVFELILHFYTYPVSHAVQLIEFSVLAISVLITPVIGIIIIKNIHKFISIEN